MFMKLVTPPILTLVYMALLHPSFGVTVTFLIGGYVYQFLLRPWLYSITGWNYLK